jgi:hypothetical protein
VRGRQAENLFLTTLGFSKNRWCHGSNCGHRTHRFCGSSDFSSFEKRWSMKKSVRGGLAWFWIFAIF